MQAARASSRLATAAASRAASRRLSSLAATKSSPLSSASRTSHPLHPQQTRALHGSSAAQRCEAAAAPAAAVGSRAGEKFVNPYANARAPNAAELKILASTVPVLAEHGITLTTQFYAKIFAKFPQLRNIFNQAHQATGMQPKALAQAVYAYAVNIENLGALGDAVKHMAHKHASLSILPEHYPLVGANLLETLDELLTSAGFARAAINDIIAAWGVAYAQLANILISAEEQLYREAEATPGGWRGWRTFVVTERVEETTPSSAEASSNVGPIVSFTLKPKDGGLLPAYLPGQYTTVQASVPAELMGGSSAKGEALITQPRQYSLSKASDNKSFRITVKREDPLPSSSVAKGGCPVTAAAALTPKKAAQCPFTGGAAAKMPHGSVAGVVSNWVHQNLQVGSEVSLAPPFGEFVLLPGKGPVVLIAAGVGITPMVPMLETAAAEGRKVSLLYATHSANKHPLRNWFAGYRAAGLKVRQAAAEASPNSHPAQATVEGAGHAPVTLRVWYESPSTDATAAAAELLGVSHDYSGRIELEQLNAEERSKLLALSDPTTEYYVCGPAPFMQAQMNALKKLGVKEHKIHAELFGAGGL